jgi:DNA-3-methyladenine glycosylase II
MLISSKSGVSLGSFFSAYRTSRYWRRRQKIGSPLTWRRRHSMTKEPAHYVKARRHLSRCDPVLKTLIASVGPCTLQLNPDRFAVLVRSIVSQQISGKAARSISGRLEELLGRQGIHPQAIARAKDEKLRTAGLSTNKLRAIRDLTVKVLDGTVDLEGIHDRDDEGVIEHLVPVYGIGRWTAEMFLIFGLGRLDVLPLADLGLRVGVQRQHGLAEVPDRERLTEMAEPWRPFRSVATWYFWRSFGPVPQSD